MENIDFSTVSCKVSSSIGFPASFSSHEDLGLFMRVLGQSSNYPKLPARERVSPWALGRRLMYKDVTYTPKLSFSAIQFELTRNSLQAINTNTHSAISQAAQASYRTVPGSLIKLPLYPAAYTELSIHLKGSNAAS